ncbi:MAG TPA: TrmB family transcriptional regulator [Desulfotomaculum sp.]|nr:MAG: TrmB family transcriptional regulator [Desulfotomaculum sp. BICA1-6]HBX23324.1 TrmB family transcriptional regulator [Desulfotomaculum sp.]
MAGETKLLDFFLDNLRKVFYPEEWIELDLELSKSQLLAMLIIDRHGELIMSQIADYLNIPLSTTTGLVNRLVKSGYLRRERSESDRRIVAIQLTETGKTLVVNIKETINQYVERIDRLLSDEERETLMHIFVKVIEALNKEKQDDTAEVESNINKIEIE